MRLRHAIIALLALVAIAGVPATAQSNSTNCKPAWKCPAPPPPPTGSDPSGVAMPLGDVTGWHQTYAEDFNTSTSIGSWSTNTCPFGGGLAGNSAFSDLCAYPDGWTDSHYATYYPSKSLSSNNGLLDYYIHTETINSAVKHITDVPEPEITGASRVGSEGGQLYGRYVVRARFDSLPGYHVAFLLWPDSENWPADGEIDFPDDPLDGKTVDAFVHYGTTSSTFDHFGGISADLTQWHTYEIDWLSSSIKFYLDGTLIGTETAHVPSKPMHWVLQTDTWSGEPAPSNTTTGHVQVSWAVAYTPA